MKRLREELTAKTERRKAIPDKDYLSLGCILLNLAVSGRWDGGVAKGQYVYVVGDSSSGKTLYTLGTMAEACRNDEFKNHRLIYDGPEFGNKFDIEKFFGRKLLNRLEPPRGTKSKPLYSATIEDFYHRIHRLQKKEQEPFIYVLDSMDALLANADNEKFEEEIEAAEKGKEVTGTYGMAKAKANSTNIKRVISMLPSTGSILFVISQTRDKLSGYGGRTRSGGRALKFYADVEIWTSVKGEVKRTVMGREREVGKQIQIDIQKNRICGWEGKIEIPIARNVGIDDVGASIDWLCLEKFWKSSKGIIKAPQFKFEGRREELAAKIESKESRQERLAFMLQAHWLKIEEASRIKRKKRYE